ncbi:MAG: MotA/TolQ/ExbB proton channel family protein [Planctomycetota bacterium]|nr:MotA/TolQ/ExbB proton channel family protein [Planctomycetota bacterium]
MNDLQELFHQGGVVLWVIGGMSVFAWSLVLWKFFELTGEHRKPVDWANEAIDRLKAGRPRSAMECCEGQESSLARVLRFALESPVIPNAFDRHYSPFLESEALRLNRSLPLIAVIAALLPLLGLLGTVLGMVNTFGAITAHGNGDPAALADGVSQALITTQAGLVTGLPILLLHGWMRSRVERVVDAATLYAKKVESNRSVKEAAYVSVGSK